MKSLSLSFALIAALSLPVAAQQMGSSNRNAPKCEQGIEFFNGAEFEIHYTALNFAQGKFMENLSKESFRKMVNDNATQNPVGSVKLSADMEIGGKPVAGGEYGLHFLISDDAKFVLTLSHKNAEGELELIQWPLALEKSPMHSDRLIVAISAGKETTSCNLYLHFGELATTIPAMCAPEKK